MSYIQTKRRPTRTGPIALTPDPATRDGKLLPYIAAGVFVRLNRSFRFTGVQE